LAPEDDSHPDDVFAVRRRKLEGLRADGIEPFPHVFAGTAPIAAVRAAHEGLGPGEETSQVHRVAGRLAARRGQGKMPTQTINWYDDWFNALPPLLGQPAYQDLVSSGRTPELGDGSIWICPQLYGNPNRFGNLFGYAMNMALSVRNAPQPDRINQVASTSSVVFMADGPAGYCSTVPFVSTDAAPAPFNPVPRHTGKVNIAFLDGHVCAFEGQYIGVNVLGDPVHPDACNQPDVVWYWYVPGPPPAPWPGP